MVLKHSDKEIDIFIGKRIAELRTDLGLTQREVAERSGVSHSHIGGIESGSQSVSISYLNTLIKFFNVSWAAFFKDLGQ